MATLAEMVTDIISIIIWAVIIMFFRELFKFAGSFKGGGNSTDAADQENNRERNSEREEEREENQIRNEIDKIEDLIGNELNTITKIKKFLQELEQVIHDPRIRKEDLKKIGDERGTQLRSAVGILRSFRNTADRLVEKLISDERQLVKNLEEDLNFMAMNQARVDVGLRKKLKNPSLDSSDPNYAQWKAKVDPLIDKNEKYVKKLEEDAIKSAYAATEMDKELDQLEVMEETLAGAMEQLITALEAENLEQTTHWLTQCKASIDGIDAGMRNVRSIGKKIQEAVDADIPIIRTSKNLLKKVKSKEEYLKAQT